LSSPAFPFCNFVFCSFLFLIFFSFSFSFLWRSFLWLRYGRTATDFEEAERDFKEEWIQVPLSASNASNPPPSSSSNASPFGGAVALDRGSGSTIPALRPKTPGFAALSSALSGGSLLSCLLAMLAPGVDALETEAARARAASSHSAIFELARTRHPIPSLPVQVVDGAARPSSDAAFFRSLAVSESLAILADVASLESEFVRRVRSAPEAVKIVQVLKTVVEQVVVKEDEKKSAEGLTDAVMHDAFDNNHSHSQGFSHSHGHNHNNGGNNNNRGNTTRASLAASTTSYRIRVSGNIDVLPLSSVDRLHSLLIAAAGSPLFASSVHSPLALIGTYIKYYAPSSDIPAGALRLFSYLTGQIPSASLPTYVLGRTLTPAALATAFGERLSAPVDLSLDPNDDVRSGVISLLIDNLQGPPPTLSHYLLGLAPAAPGDNTPRSITDLDCLTSILNLFSNHVEFLTNSATCSLASRCYELLYKLMSDPVTKKQTRQRLNEVDFYATHTDLLTMHSGENNLVTSAADSAADCEDEDADSGNNSGNNSGNAAIHALSWLLKGVSCELFEARLNNEDGKVREILRKMFAGPDCAVVNLLRSLPARAPGGGRPLDTQPKEAAEKVKRSVVTLKGDAGVMGGFRVVDLRILGELLGQNRPGPKGEGGSVSVPSPLPEHDVSAIDWSFRWNRFATALCSASHLASAWSTFVSTAVSSTLESLTATDDGVVEPAEISALLQRVMETVEGDEGEPNLETQPALHLARAALSITYALREARVPADEACVSGIASAIASSARGGEGGEDVSGILACALSQTVESWKGGEIGQEAGGFLAKATTLMMDLACGAEQGEEQQGQQGRGGGHQYNMREGRKRRSVGEGSGGGGGGGGGRGGGGGGGVDEKEKNEDTNGR